MSEDNEQRDQDGPQLPSPSDPGFFSGMVVMGFVLVVVSCFVCAGTQSPIPFFLAAAGAIVSLFFPGYRGIFVGFAGTVGLAYLALIVICGALGNPHF